ncbi:MAG: M48 family metalloprotease [Actinomycetota bacterium]|nr:M48 family metalloprotease [Actinomycetota bacterium]
MRSNVRRRRALVLLAGGVPGAFAGVVAGIVGGAVIGLVVALVVCGGVALAVARSATRRALAVIGGRPVDAREVPRLANLVEGLCATCGVRPPALRLVEDAVPNACALGAPGRGVLVVTTGLVQSVGLLELEGVVAHELAHVKNHDAAVSEVAVTVLAPIVRLTARDALVHRSLGRGREYAADREAASMVRSPRGLERALETMEHSPSPSAGSRFTGWRWSLTRWLWIDPMVGARDAPTLGTIDATSVRCAALAEW